MKSRLAFLLACLSPLLHAAVEMRVDARIELLTAVQSLSDYEYLSKLSHPYRANLEAYFGPYRDHAAVRQFVELRRSGFSLDAPATLMLHLSDPPELAVQAPLSDYLIRRAGSRERLEQWIAALRDFARDARFSEFWTANRGTYDQVERAARSGLGTTDYTGVLERYHGIAKRSYTVVLGMLIHSGGFGPSVRREDGTEDIYSIIGPVSVTGGLANFGGSDRMIGILWHEFGHSFANPIVEAHQTYLLRFGALFEPIRAAMTRQQYSDWITCMKEHLVRAVHVRLIYRELGAAAGENAYRYERSQGFAYLDALLLRLQEYEGARDRYPTLRSLGEELFRGLEAELSAVGGVVSSESGKVSIRATPGVVKQRLFTTIGSDGTLVRESRDEAEYTGMGVTVVFRLERREGETVLSIEPVIPGIGEFLMAVKSAAEADPDMRGDFGVVASAAADGRLQAAYVREASRAETFGLRRGDVLVDWSTMYRFPVNAAELDRLRDLPADARATVRVVREGQEVELNVGGQTP